MALIGTRRSKIIRRTGRAVLLHRLKIFGVSFGAVVFVLWLGAWLYFSGGFSSAGAWAEQKTVEMTAETGFTVKNIMVEGREFTDADALRAIINIDKGDPLFSFHPAEARAQIEQLSWVKSARVERRLPDTIYIGITERVPMALWQKDKDFKLIDTDGQVIETTNLRRFKDLVIVMGDEAPAHAHELLENINAEPVLRARTTVARWVDGRRWDLDLGQDIQVKLPEKDTGLALRRLADAQKEGGLLDKDITTIDLREADRIIVRTRPGAVQEYKASGKAGSNI